MAYIVKHKNPNVAVTNDGKEWSIDGEGEDWIKAMAEAHTLRCEFAAHNIPFEIVQIRKKLIPRAEPKPKPEKADADPLD